MRTPLICALGAIALLALPAAAAGRSRSWSRCHGSAAKYRLSVRGGLPCGVAYGSLTDFNTSALPQRISGGMTASTSGSTAQVEWSQLGDRFSYVDYGHRWRCSSPYDVTTCTTDHSMAMRYAGNVWDAPSYSACSGPQPPYSTAWSGNGPYITPGPVHSPNVTCALALQVEYADAVSRAGGSGPAQATNMLSFPQGFHYTLALPGGSSWQCSVQMIVGPTPDSIVLTIGGASYDTDQYIWRCDSYSVAKLGQEATWSVAEPHCSPQPDSAASSQPPAICKP